MNLDILYVIVSFLLMPLSILTISLLKGNIRNLNVNRITGISILVLEVANYQLYYRYGYNNNYLLYLLLLYYLIVVSIIDFYTYRITFNLAVFGFVLTIILSILNPNSNPLINFISFLVSAAILLSIVTITKGGIGGGDVIIISQIILCLGFRIGFVILFLGIFICGILGIIGLMTKRRNRKSIVPFVPYVLIAYIIIVI